MCNSYHLMRDPSRTTRLGPVVEGTNRAIGNTFSSRHFSEEMFDGRMDPLLMVDEFVMTGPTFAPHLHAGISVVTVILEDSIGDFLSRDTLGLEVQLKAGDLYWLAAAGGAAHEEKPSDDARIHALQIFVDLPKHLKTQPARAIHVQANDVVLLREPTHRVRDLLARSNTIRGAGGMPEEMLMLDGVLDSGGIFEHQLGDNLQALIYAISGDLCVYCDGDRRHLSAGQATTIGVGAAITVVLEAGQPAHFVLLSAKPLGESFKAGPLIMANTQEVRRAQDRFKKR